MSCLRIGAAAALAAFTVAPAGGQVPAYSEAVLLVHPAEYFGTMYTAPPDHAAYLFFTGEPLRVELEIVNRGSHVIELAGPAAAAHRFRVSNGQASQFVVENEIIKKGLGAPTRVETQSAVSLAPGESLALFSKHVGPALAPGEYLVEWETSITETSGLRIAPQASRLQFEVRESSGETAAEEVRRYAIRAFEAGQDALADQWVTRLLRLNPQSHAAHVLRAELRLRAGDNAAAAASFDTALKILESHADQQFERWAPPTLTRDTLDGLKARRHASK
jgi:hypothetical protein